MPRNGILPWESLERWSATLFLLSAGILACNAGILLYDVLEGTMLRLPLGQVFVGAGWAVALVGMLGLYPGLAERRPWLARGCAFFAAVGVYGYAVMAAAFGAAVAGIPMSTVSSFEIVYFPAVLAGTFLAFPLFAVAGLLTGGYSKTVSVLLGAPTAIFVGNVLTGPTPDSIFGVLVALVLAFGSIGYLLRTDGGSVEGGASPTNTSV